MTSSSDLPGRDPWVVLGGGGLKGLGHVGAWKAMVERGLRPRGIVGTSIGALVGICLGGGMSWRELDPLARSLERDQIAQVNRRVVWINGVKARSLYQGEPLREYVESIVPVSDWSELELPVQVNAVDLDTGETEWFGPGARTDVSPLDAVMASAALPLFYPPVEVGRRYLVDGGVGDALPLERAAALGAASIVAVDVGSAPETDGATAVERGMVAIHQRVFSIMAGRRRRETVQRWSGPPLTYVRPDLAGYSGFEFDAVDYFLDEGYRATRAVLGNGTPGSP